MNTLSLGSKIKALRKAHGITQEQLADTIGISFQSVSKWENNIALPDVTLVPVIASYFGITLDELFDFNLRELNKKVEAICTEAYKYRESDPAKSKEILEDGLKQYPDNDIILNNMLYVMNYSENPDETITFANRLIEKTDKNDVKYDAYRFLAYAYDSKGDTVSAIAALEQIPEIYFTKLSEMAFIQPDRQLKYEAAEKQKWISFEMLLQMMGKLAECFEDGGNTEDAVREAKRALRLIEALSDEPKINCFDNYKEYINRQIDRLCNL